MTPITPVTSITDEELMTRVQAGDLGSYGVLARRYNTPLLLLARRYLGRQEDAEEVRQEALLKALDQARRFDPAGQFRAWIYRIAVNLCHDRSRRNRRWRFLSLTPAEEGEPAADLPAPQWVTAEDWVDQSNASQRLRRALRSLPHEQRAVLVLKEMDGMTFREIADLLACPESTVKSRLYRGLSALRDALEAEERAVTEGGGG